MYKKYISNIKVESSGAMLNPVIKDSNWVNASSVPSNMKNNILSNTSEEYNMEIHDTDGNNNLSEAFTEENEMKPYNINITPMNPIERTYNSSQQSYFDEMQKSKNPI